MTVFVQGIDKVSIQVDGVNAKQALNPANDTVNKGLYDATTLHAVDADLAAGNIKSGITIFGFVGPATVQDISAANATVAQVLASSTFFSVTGAIKTGTMPNKVGSATVITPSTTDQAFPQGYYGGAVGDGKCSGDANLVTGNIKSGVTIFGVSGVATVQDISAANATVAQVLASSTFFSVTGAIKTGTMPTVALAAGNSAYPTGYHAGAASLQAVDGNLAVGNIKNGVNIFGYVGTYAPTLVQDTSGSAGNGLTANDASGYYYYNKILAGADLACCSVTPTFAVGSRAAGVGYICAQAVSGCKLQLWMGGALIAESAYLTGGVGSFFAIGSVALAGAQTCSTNVHNYTAGDIWLTIAGMSGAMVGAGLGVDSMKAV